MKQSRLLTVFLTIYLGAVFVFIFAPIVASVVFSFNSDRFPTIPLGTFTTKWYTAIAANPQIAEAFRTSAVVAASSAVLATFIGFCTAYTDYRFSFRGKGLFLALGLLPPTIPAVIMGLAMLAWFSRLQITGTVTAIVIAHTVLCAPFATAVILLRLAQMDPNLEPAAWNLGASQWRTMREVILPFTLPSIVSALCLTAAVSFDEFAVAWFVSGLNKTVPVAILEILTGNVDPQINAIGTIVFATTVILVIAAQLLAGLKQRKADTAK